ncbi:hypothetical protein [Aeromicrobium chenweiae]|uniref:Uncharacterized protein n=1 Tax=Aeromicrobium chenweiae TaxID=2079793 RepID=A0A2S0WMU1_9ACTN|nr:hypothetical protein [Aeromicrobium chenweiae]AWB92627.1 hypothetical protein C3E78_10685 [Aeromicrobium chenweiae]TGN33615.1 hypothetical protein E4L97_00725 [Aeromicrobium chenweiae]
MTDIGEVRFGGRAKWGRVTSHLVLAALGAFLTVVAFVAVPADVHAVRALGWYTLAATVLTLAVTAALAGVGQLPTLHAASVDGDEGRGVEAWPWEWRYDLALDLGLGIVLVVVAAIGAAAGNGWLAPSVVVALAAAWFLVRVGLSLSGRRRNEALWLTRGDLVHDTVNGRGRCGRDHVTRVSTIDRFVIADVDTATTQKLPPRPWRRRRRLNDPRTMVFDTSMTGHTPEQIADWLRTELRLEDPRPLGGSPRSATRRRHTRG